MAARKAALPRAAADTASLYVRLSKEAAETNLSKDGMLDDVRALAAKVGLRVVGEHLDDGLSGAIRNRPEFVAWLDDVREGRASHLIAWHIDRMTREGVNVAAQILDAVEGKDPVTGRVVREPAVLLDTTGLDSRGDEAAFRFRFVIAAEVARAERERMRERMRAAHRRAAAAGRWAGGPPPFGFEIVDNPEGAGRVIEVAEAEAAFLRECAARVLGGSNLSAVVRYANGPEGMAPRRAEAWSRITMRQCLTGPLAGRVLGADSAAAVRRLLAQKPDTFGKSRRPGARLLSGLLRCHSCDSLLTVSRRTDGSVTYRCQMAREAGLCSRPVSVSAPALEAYVAGAFLAGQGDAPFMVRRASVAGAAAVEAAEEEVALALAELGNAGTAENFARLQEAQAVRELALAVPAEAVVTLEPTGRTVAEEWEAGAMEDRRAMLQANLADIVILPGQRGRRGIRPERVVMVWHAAFPAGAVDVAGFAPGRMVV